MTRFLPTLGSICLALFVMYRCYQIGYDLGYTDLSEESFEQYQRQIKLANNEVMTLNRKLSALDQTTTKQKAKLRKDIDGIKKQVKAYRQRVSNLRSQCIDADWLHIHDNAAALPTQANDTSAASVANGETRTIDAGETLEIIVGNYGKCALYRKQIEGLQGYIREILRLQKS